MPRLATPSDLTTVLRLALGKNPRTWPSQTPEESSQAILRSLGQSAGETSDFDLFVKEAGEDITGYLLLKKQIVRGLTGDRESVVCDYYAAETGEERLLFEQAALAAESYRSSFLTIQLSPHDSPTRSLLERLGFRLESHRISVPSGEPKIPRESPYSVRPATSDDAFLIGVLNSMMLSHTLSAGRDYDLGELTMQSMGNIMAQASRKDLHCTGLVLTFEKEMVGHLLLELTERMGYIYDLALAREHWGGTAVRHIMRAGSKLLYERNIPLFVGDVSASNRRALIVAQRALGFQVDCNRYGLTLPTSST